MSLNRREFLFGAAACGICATTGMGHSHASTPSFDLSHTSICGASPFPTWNGIIKTRPPHPQATKVLEWIMHSAGVEGNFKLLEGDFNKGFTAIAGIHSKFKGRFIVYDKQRFKWPIEKPNFWEVYVLGHEFGHHANGDNLYVLNDNKWERSHSRSAWERELAADRTGGFFVRKLGGSLEEPVQYFLDHPYEGGKTHPSSALRIQAITQGWHQADNLLKWQKIQFAQMNI